MFIVVFAVTGCGDGQKTKAYYDNDLSTEAQGKTPAKRKRHQYSAGFPSKREKRQVITWIWRNGLNKFGDKMGTMYAGSTPLYDEMTGEYMTRYEYLIKKHPEKPWLEIELPEDEENAASDGYASDE